MDQTAVIVLTGGGSTRMGSHKPALDVGGRPIIARILAAVAGLPVVVVGDGAGVPAGVPVVREEPPGGGPVAGVASGFTSLERRYAAEPGAAVGDLERVVLLAGDLPFVSRAAIDALTTALDAGPEGEGSAGEERAQVALATDAAGQVNWLCAAWRAAALRGRLAELGEPSGTSMRRLTAGLRQVLVQDETGWSLDVDTPADLADAQLRAAAPAPAPPAETPFPSRTDR